jgi:hypothetical protein
LLIRIQLGNVGHLTKKTLPLNPLLLPREGEAEGGGEFIKAKNKGEIDMYFVENIS